MLLNDDYIIVAVDTGYDSTKVYTVINGKVKCFDYKSKYEFANDDLNTNNTVHFSYGNNDIIIGEGATMHTLELDKTVNDVYKILTYRALAELSNCIGKKFVLVTGYPLTLVSSEKERFKEYLMSDEVVECEFEGEKKVFEIMDCIVLPQCAGSLLSEDTEQYENKTLGIVDLGGRTGNGVIFDNLNVVRESMFTEDLGYFFLSTEIKNRLYAELKVSVKDYQMKYIIKEGTKSNKQKSLQIIDKCMRNHVFNIQKVLVKNGWDLDNTMLKFIGGTSILLDKYLREIFPDCIVTTDIYDNAKGFYNVGVASYGL